MAERKEWTVPRRVTTLHVYKVLAHNTTEAAVLAGMMLAQGEKPSEVHEIGATWLGANKVIPDEDTGDGKKK